MTTTPMLFSNYTNKGHTDFPIFDAAMTSYKHYAKRFVAIQDQAAIVSFMDTTSRSIHNEEINYNSMTKCLGAIDGLAKQIVNDQKQLNLRVARDTVQNGARPEDLEAQVELTDLSNELKQVRKDAVKMKNKYAPNITWGQWTKETLTSKKAIATYGAVGGYLAQLAYPLAKTAGTAAATVGCQYVLNNLGNGTFTFPNGTSINGTFVPN
jgi:hypothetical protein